MQIFGRSDFLSIFLKEMDFSKKCAKRFPFSCHISDGNIFTPMTKLIGQLSPGNGEQNSYLNIKYDFAISLMFGLFS